MHSTRKQMPTFLDLLCELHYRHAMHTTLLRDVFSFHYSSKGRLKHSVLTLIENSFYYILLGHIMNSVCDVKEKHNPCIAGEASVAKWKTEVQPEKFRSFLVDFLLHLKHKHLLYFTVCLFFNQRTQHCVKLSIMKAQALMTSVAKMNDSIML